PDSAFTAKYVNAPFALPPNEASKLYSVSAHPETSSAELESDRRVVTARAMRVPTSRSSAGRNVSGGMYRTRTFASDAFAIGANRVTVPEWHESETST